MFRVRGEKSVELVVVQVENKGGGALHGVPERDQELLAPLGRHLARRRAVDGQQVMRGLGVELDPGDDVRRLGATGAPVAFLWVEVRLYLPCREQPCVARPARVLAPRAASRPRPCQTIAVDSERITACVVTLAVQAHASNAATAACI